MPAGCCRYLAKSRMSPYPSMTAELPSTSRCRRRVDLSAASRLRLLFSVARRSRQSSVYRGTTQLNSTSSWVELCRYKLDLKASMLYLRIEHRFEYMLQCCCIAGKQENLLVTFRGFRDLGLNLHSVDRNHNGRKTMYRHPLARTTAPKTTAHRDRSQIPFSAHLMSFFRIRTIITKTC